MLTLTDPEAVAACFAAGVGPQLTLPVGGKLTPAFYQPVAVTGRVKTLTDGEFTAELPPMPVHNGRTAVFQAGGITMVLSEQPAMSIDREVYHSSGLRPQDFRLVQVKSPGGFRAIYSAFAAAIFELDTPGPTDSDLPRLPFKRIRRPLWPFDPDWSNLGRMIGNLRLYHSLRLPECPPAVPSGGSGSCQRPGSRRVGAWSIVSDSSEPQNTLPSPNVSRTPSLGSERRLGAFAVLLSVSTVVSSLLPFRLTFE